MSHSSSDQPGKIGYLISTYPALSHTFILREIQRLTQMGWQIHIASINNHDRLFEQLLPEEQAHAATGFYIKRAGISAAALSLIKTLLMNPVGFFSTLAYALQLGGWHIKDLLLYIAYFVEAVMLAGWMQQNKLSHLHVHFAGPAASVGMLCKKLTDCAYSVTVHGPDELSDVSKQRLRQKFAAADQIICITHYAQSRVMLHADHADWHKTRIVRVGLNPAPFLKLGQNRPSSSDVIPQLLSIGRLAPAKGQIILLEALAKLKERQCKAHLTLIGGGPLQAELEKKAQQLGLTAAELTFAGGRNQEQVKELLRNSDLFVMSSFAEGLPVVLMEALLSGLPCIATYIAGIPELIRHGKDGLLVPAGNASALSEAMECFIRDPDFARQTANSGREQVLAMHDIALTMLGLSDCFKELSPRSVHPNHEQICILEPV